MTTSKDDRVITAVQTVGEALSTALGSALPRQKEWSAAAAHLPKEFGVWSRTVDALNAVGWLPYHSAPFQYVEECGDDLDLLDRRFSGFYRTQWDEIRDDMELRLAGYHVDAEARATFLEALSAHEAELYRCVCRVLFPEIERMIGAGFQSKRLLKELTETGDLADYAFKERFGYVLFGRLVKHVYVSGKRKRFQQDPVPNRQAAVHGLASYSTHKHSMNMLILTDYIFQILPPKTGPRA